MIKNVAVYLGSKTGNREIFAQTARGLGGSLAKKGYNIIYGGACVGTMKELADGAIASGGKVTGVFPDKFKGKKESREKGLEIQHNGLTGMILVKDMGERKKVMEEQSDCCIILPGSFGTLDELFEYAVHRQLEFHFKPVIILNLNGYYNPLRQMVENMKENGFIREEETSLLTYCDTIEDVLEFLENSRLPR